MALAEPLDHADPGAEGERLIEELHGEERQQTQRGAGDDHADRCVDLFRDLFRPPNQDGVHPSAESGADADGQGGDEVTGLEWPARHLVQQSFRCGQGHRDEGQVGGSGRHERGQQGPVGEIVPVRRFEGEQHPRGRGLENGGHAGGGAGGQQQPGRPTPEPAVESL